jgi:hypothetical protein
MKQTQKTPNGGLVIEAQLLRELGFDADVEFEVRCEGKRLVLEVARGPRLQRLAEDLDRLMAAQAQELSQLLRE